MKETRYPEVQVHVFPVLWSGKGAELIARYLRVWSESPFFVQAENIFPRAPNITTTTKSPPVQVPVMRVAAKGRRFVWWIQMTRKGPGDISVAARRTERGSVMARLDMTEHPLRSGQGKRAMRRAATFSSHIISEPILLWRWDMGKAA